MGVKKTEEMERGKEGELKGGRRNIEEQEGKERGGREECGEKGRERK